MSLIERLEAAQQAARAYAGHGEEVLAVLPAEPGRNALVYLIAYGEGGGGHVTYLGLDAAHHPVDDRRLVRDAVTMLALAERAEEVSGATAAAQLTERMGEARQLLDREGHATAAAAAAEVLAAVERLQEAAAGPRVATPRYLDRIAAAAADLGAAQDAYELEVEQLGRALVEAGVEPLAALAPAWQALAAVAEAGDPGNVSASLAASTGSVEALVGEVVESYRLPLV